MKAIRIYYCDECLAWHILADGLPAGLLDDDGQFDTAEQALAYIIEQIVSIER